MRAFANSYITQIYLSSSYHTSMQDMESSISSEFHQIYQRCIRSRRAYIYRIYIQSTHWSIVLQFIPKLFQCTSYPVTSILETLWTTYRPKLIHGFTPDPCVIETIAMLERSLNYGHTGSARVLTRKIMDRAWLSMSVIHDGLPCISPMFIRPASLSTGLITVQSDKWPVDRSSHRPLTASKRTQEITWGESHYQVSIDILLSMFWSAFPQHVKMRRLKLARTTSCPLM